MTVVAGIVDKKTGDVIMGADSAATSPDGDTVIVKTPKVFSNGELVIGFAGSYRLGQLFKQIKVPRLKKNGDVERFMALDFADTLRLASRQMGCIGDDHGFDVSCGVGLVGIRGRLFAVLHTFESVEAADGVMAIGSGSPYALGALRAIREALPAQDAETQIRQALEVSEYYTATVRGPFDLVRLRNAHTGKTAASHRRNSQGNRRHSRRKA